jgi:putative toxin-antitoxin system antitoxin component (TIGR02293 family)
MADIRDHTEDAGAVSADDLAAIVERATAVIGGKDRAMRWLGTPVPSLGYATPISLLHTPEGYGRVEAILGRIEHGIW